MCTLFVLYTQWLHLSLFGVKYPVTQSIKVWGHEMLEIPLCSYIRALFFFNPSSQLLLSKTLVPLMP